MEHLPKGLTLELCCGAFPLSTDSMLLAHFVSLGRNAAVIDLGSGCGTLGLLLCAEDDTCHITGIELTENAHLTALENIRANGLERRMVSICADLRHFACVPGSFSCAVSNPPFFSSGPASLVAPLARRDDCCAPDDLFRAAARAVKYGGDFFLVHKPEKLAQLIACGASHNLEAKRLRLIRHREGGPITLVLLQFRKGGKPGLQIDEFSLYDPQNAPTAFYREVYHM